MRPPYCRFRTSTLWRGHRSPCAPFYTRLSPSSLLLTLCGVLAAAFIARDRVPAVFRAVAVGGCDLRGAPSPPPLSPVPRYARAPPSADALRIDFVWVSASVDLLRDSVSSVCHFYASPVTLHLVVPDASVAEAQVSTRYVCNASTQRVRVWAESTVVPAFGEPGAGARYPGTLRQMLLKLVAATACVSDAAWYVVMDSDVYARRHFSAADLLIAGPRGGAPRARTDFDYPWHAQPESWSTEAGALLGTPLAADTHAWCAARQSVFSLRAPEVLDAARPFALASGGPSGRRVYGACFSGRGGGTHVTPMIFSVELIRNVLAPRLRERAASSLLDIAAPWYASALAFHAQREQLCLERGIDVSRGERFYSWTEYSLYSVAAIAAEALDDFHDFGSGALLSFAHSAFDPLQFEFWAPDAVLDDAQDPAPLFLVHGWLSPVRAAAGTAVHELFTRRGVVKEA